MNNKIITISLVVLVALAILAAVCRNSEPPYKVSAQDMLKISLEQKHTVNPEKLTDILYTKDTLFRFIDLRTPHEFAQGHIEGAINIPAHEILDTRYKKIFNQSERINILYHSTHAKACAPWMILRQLGYINNRVLLGGYDFVANNMIKNFAIMSGKFADEKPMYNFAEEMAKNKGAQATTDQIISKPENTTKTSAPVKKEKKQGGGC